MNIGDKIDLNIVVAKIATITNIVPVAYRDDGDDSWFEVCDAAKTDYVAIIGEDNMKNEIAMVINRNSDNLDLLLDLF